MVMSLSQLTGTEPWHYCRITLTGGKDRVMASELDRFQRTETSREEAERLRDPWREPMQDRNLAERSVNSREGAEDLMM